MERSIGFGGDDIMRINAKERKSNARQWYSLLIDSYNAKSAVVVRRYESSNPDINRIQLLSCNTLEIEVKKC